MAQEVLELHVSGMAGAGEKVPAPSSLEAIMADPENGDAVAFLVTLQEPADSTVWVNITLPERLLRRIEQPLRLPGSRRGKSSLGELIRGGRKPILCALLLAAQ